LLDESAESPILKIVDGDRQERADAIGEEDER